MVEIHVGNNISQIVSGVDDILPSFSKFMSVPYDTMIMRRKKRGGYYPESVRRQDPGKDFGLD